MDWDWGTIASCGSAVAAFVALFISLRQGRMSNKQSLFERRLRIWIVVEKLMFLYRSNSDHLDIGDGPQLHIELCFKWLTNTTFLQEIQLAIAHVLESGYQLKLHLKLDEMKSLSAEAIFVFKFKPKVVIAEFIEAYQALLFSMYRYQIVINGVQANANKFHLTFERAAEQLDEERYRADLSAAIDRLAVAHEKLDCQRMIKRIQRQISLDCIAFRV